MQLCAVIQSLLLMLLVVVPLQVGSGVGVAVLGVACWGLRTSMAVATGRRTLGCHWLRRVPRVETGSARRPPGPPAARGLVGSQVQSPRLS
jgi:hypothetical protein